MDESVTGKQTATGGTSDRLATVMKAPLPKSFSTLPSELRADLAELVEQATARRVQLLTHAALGALDSVPVFLRGAVRKAVGL
ncbi:hypothetical protein [Nocardia amamiensis]|uniref:hypothetical protein n=1 Tax=Nocardia amamiensis TaxID=404578 RepID=UPI0033FB8B08